MFSGRSLGFWTVSSRILPGITLVTPARTVRIAAVDDSGSQGLPALRGRTATLAAGARHVAGTSPPLVCVGDRGCLGSAAEANPIVLGCPPHIGAGSAAFKSFMEEASPGAYLDPSPPRAWLPASAVGRLRQ
ncbi:MAG TPA: hypothetical protein VGI55_12075, partial [Solirubrobacteraceae bacterium]